ncbi:MAG TPA: type II toxin-antitoxin system prevent-host-death family antitoxin [Actinomycetota bacterium]
MCYTWGMEIASRELRNQTRAVLERVEAGEEVTITVAGRPVAILMPAQRRRAWMPRDEFERLLASRRADPSLAGELAALMPDTTDDIRL